MALQKQNHMKQITLLNSHPAASLSFGQTSLGSTAADALLWKLVNLI